MKVNLLRLCFVCVVLVFTHPTRSAQEKTGVEPGAKDASSERGAALTSHLKELLSAVGVAVREDAPSAPRARSYREVKVTWEADKTSPLSHASAAPNQNPPGLVSLSGAGRTRDGGLPKQRSAELSASQIMLVAVDAENRLRWWSLLNDPRLVRAESTGPDGELTGQLLYKESAEFTLDYPDDEAITELRLYHPDWNGKNFSLKLIGSVAAF
jgi:hypothetical protein